MSMKTYFIQQGDDGPIKIGKSSNVMSRLGSLASSNPGRLRLLGVLDGDHEEMLHELLMEHRIRGEWFSPHPDVLAEAVKSSPFAKGPKKNLPLPEWKSGELSVGPSDPIGPALRALREAAGLTMDQVAATMGTGKSRISRVENSEDTEPSWAWIVRFAQACGKDAELVLEPREDEPKGRQLMFDM